MSLILEALKKSEAERRIGEAPGLLSPSASVAASKQPASRTWLWVLLPLLLVLALATAWWLGRMGGAESDTQARDDSAAMTAVSSDATSPSPATSTRVESADNGRRSDTSTPAATRTTATTSTEPPRPAPPRDPPPRTAAPSQAPATALPRAPGERESMPVVPGELPEPPPHQVEREPVQSTTTAAESKPVNDEARPAEPPRDRLPTLRQLDSATRGELPPLRISMHVFTDQPDGRFVIIDNHRYGEGASVASGLNIAEIRRDGVVMDYRGRRFLIDRPG